MRVFQRACIYFVSICLLLACTLTIHPPMPSPRVDDIFTLNQRLGRGINFGNALEAPNYEGEWGLRLREEYFQLVTEAGFDSVRVPIRWSAHARKSEPFTIDPRFFERIDWVTAFVARTAEERGISWAYWEFGSGFGAFDLARAGWNEALIQALIPAELE